MTSDAQKTELEENEKGGYLGFRLAGDEDWKDLKVKNKGKIEEETQEETGCEKAGEPEENKKILKDFLLSSMQMQHVMILAGSGTSRGGVGGPSMGDLWEKSTAFTETFTAENLKEVRKKTNYERAKGKHNNIEEFLSSCEAYLQIRKKDKLVINFVKKAKGAILSCCCFKTKEEQLDAHKKFLHRLSRRRGRDSRLKVFTTNYDLCFEKAAGELGLVSLDGFSFSKPRIYNPLYFDYDIVRRDESSNNDVPNYLEGVFKLYKLHGSVNWERVKKGEKNFIFETDKAKANNVCMIFPAKGKYQQSYIQPHLELMARYLSSLRMPNTCLIVCGFGFNDDHLSEPILSAINTNPHLRVLIVNLHAKNNVEKDHPYWKKLKALADTGEDVSFFNASFGDFANLIPDLRAMSDAERLAQDVRALVR